MPAVRAMMLMPGGHLELLDGVAQLVALLALDAARYAAAARVVRHQDQVAAGEADERGQRGALGAALVLVDLDDEFLAFAQRVLDAGAGGIDVAFGEIRRLTSLNGRKPWRSAP